MALDFVSLDFETAGLDRGTPCAVGMVKFRDGRRVDAFERLLQPVPRGWDPNVEPLETFFHPMCVNVHGITAADVTNAPAFWQAWPEIWEFMDGLPVVAHNAAFDLGVLRTALDYADEAWPSLDYGCTLVLGRRTYDLASYRLPFVAAAAGVPFDGAAHHGALYDADVAGRVFLDIASKHEAVDVEDLAARMKAHLGRLRPDSWEGCTTNSHKRRADARLAVSKDVVVNADADPNHPIYGLGITFTGTLGSMTRDEARHLVASLGAVPIPSPTKKTNLLVFGEQDASRLRPGMKQSSKYEKALQMKSEGADIEVISETDFLALIADGSNGGTR